MKLPNCEQAVVPLRKLTDYLLDDTHPQNSGKAAFFGLVGFTIQNPLDLETALCQHSLTNEVVATIGSEFGIRYVVEGWMPCPNGKAYPIRSVWFIPVGEDVPRLVTAYPN